MRINQKKRGAAAHQNLPAVCCHLSLDEGGDSTPLCKNKRWVLALGVACTLFVFIVFLQQSLLVLLLAWDVFLCALLMLFLFHADEGGSDARGKPAVLPDVAPAAPIMEQPQAQKFRRGEMLVILPLEITSTPSHVRKPGADESVA